LEQHACEHEADAEPAEFGEVLLGDQVREDGGYGRFEQAEYGGPRLP
jgi:hypothetical protein